MRAARRAWTATSSAPARCRPRPASPPARWRISFTERPRSRSRRSESSSSYRARHHSPPSIWRTSCACARQVQRSSWRLRASTMPPKPSTIWSTSSLRDAWTSWESTSRSSAGGANELRHARPSRRRGHVRPDRAGLRHDEPTDDGGPRPAPGATDGRGRGAPPRQGARSVGPRRRAGGGGGAGRRPSHGARLLRANARARTPEVDDRRVDFGRHARASVRGRIVRYGDGRVRDPQRRGPRRRARRAGTRAPARRPSRLSRDHASEWRASTVLRSLVRRARAAGRTAPSWRVRLHLSARERPSLPGARRSGQGDAQRRIRRGRLAPPRRRDRRTPRCEGRMSALATVRAAPGLDAYLELLEARLERSVGSHPGLVGEIGADTLAAGGKRLRPVLVFLCTPPDDRGGERAVAGGAAVELVHMATLVHDDLLDGADLRRGRPTAWAEHGDVAAKATGDYLFARAFSELAGTGDAQAVAVLADAALALARGEALQRRQAFRPDTTVEEYLARCSLKTGKLFEAACLLGGRSGTLGAFG